MSDKVEIMLEFCGDSASDGEMFWSKADGKGFINQAKPTKFESVSNFSPWNTIIEDPEVGSSSSAVQVNNFQEIRCTQRDDDDDDEDSNDEADEKLHPVCAQHLFRSIPDLDTFGSTCRQNIVGGFLKPSALRVSSSPPPVISTEVASSTYKIGKAACKVPAQSTGSTSSMEFLALQMADTGICGSGVLGNNTTEFVNRKVFVDGVAVNMTFLFGSNFSERAIIEERGEVDKDEGPPLKKRKIGDSERGVEKSRDVIKEEMVSSSIEDIRNIIIEEEEEVNVLQLRGRLLRFDKKNLSWMDRGYGLLRLKDLNAVNDDEKVSSSRLVMHMDGSLRVILNANVWDGMLVERVDKTNVWITVVDSEAMEHDNEVETGDGARGSPVMIYLIMADKIPDALALREELRSRIRKLHKSN